MIEYNQVCKVVCHDVPVSQFTTTNDVASMYYQVLVCRHYGLFDLYYVVLVQVPGIGKISYEHSDTMSHCTTGSTVYWEQPLFFLLAILVQVQYQVAVVQRINQTTTSTVERRHCCYLVLLQMAIPPTI